MRPMIAAGLFFTATTALLSVGLAGKWNGTEIIKTTTVAKVKVVRTDGAPELLELTVPTTTGRLVCTEDAFRVKQLGHHWYPATSTIKVESDLKPTLEAAHAKKFDAACLAGDRAANIGLSLAGKCKLVKVRVGVVGTTHKVKQVPFELDCHGYGAPKRLAVTLYYSPTKSDFYSGTRPSHAKPGYAGVRVQGQAVWASEGTKTRPLRLYFNPVKSRYFTVAHPSTIQSVRDAGAAQQSILANIYVNPVPGGTSLVSYQKGDDVALGSTPDDKAELAAKGYKMLRVEGYLLPAK